MIISFDFFVVMVVRACVFLSLLITSLTGGGRAHVHHRAGQQQHGINSNASSGEVASPLLLSEVCVLGLHFVVRGVGECGCGDAVLLRFRLSC